VEGKFCELLPFRVLGSSTVLAAFATIGTGAPVGSAWERSSAVYARVSTLEGSPQQIDEGLRYLREEILPTGSDDPGFKGLIALADRNSGKTLSITLWESEEEMRATEQDANQLRSAWSETSGQQIASVESYEVGLYEVES
jgi:heme-degrading monooxygenase HmoA